MIFSAVRSAPRTASNPAFNGRGLLIGELAIIATIAKVAGFLFCLLLFFSHVIELRFIEHNLNRVVPTQIIVLGENCADLLFQIARNLDLASL